MKHIFLLTALAFVALLSSCKKDPKPAELLLGNWKATKIISDGEDILAPNPDYLEEVNVEFTDLGSAIFTIKVTDLTTPPPTTDEFTSTATYSLDVDGERMIMSVGNGSDKRSVTCDLDVSKTHLVITSISGDLDYFFTLLEADKL